MMQVFVRIAVISMSGLPACELSAEHRVILIVLPTERSYPPAAVAVPEEKYALPTMLVDTPLVEKTSVLPSIALYKYRPNNTIGPVP